MSHPKEFRHGTIEQIALETARLHHRSRKQFIDKLRQYIAAEAQADSQVGNKKLSGLGNELAAILQQASDISEKIALLTEKHEARQAE